MAEMSTLGDVWYFIYSRNSGTFTRYSKLFGEWMCAARVVSETLNRFLTKISESPSYMPLISYHIISRPVGRRGAHAPPPPKGQKGPPDKTVKNLK